jgi:hypothetical protein
MCAFFGQSAKKSFDTFGCKKGFCTFGLVFQKTHFFNQQILHELYHTTGTAVNSLGVIRVRAGMKKNVLVLFW